jgi:hypothetical protein
VPKKKMKKGKNKEVSTSEEEECGEGYYKISSSWRM